MRPETLAQDAELKQQAAEGKLPKAQYLRFTSPERTPYPENDLVNARWYPAPAHKDPARPKQAIIVMPQWNADGFSHNSLCTIFNRMGVSALRLSKPYHDIRRPAELERSDYAVSANIGRTISACRQAVVDIRCCLDWLEEQGYEHFGVLGTSLGSCYGISGQRARCAAARECLQPRVYSVWRCGVGRAEHAPHSRRRWQQAGLTQDRLRALWATVSPVSYYSKICQAGSRRPAETRSAGLRQLRSHISAGVLAQGGRGRPPIRLELRSARAALRPLHHRRNALQIHRRMVSWAGLCIARSRRCAKKKRPAYAHASRPAPDAEEEAVSR